MAEKKLQHKIIIETLHTYFADPYLFFMGNAEILKINIMFCVGACKWFQRSSVWQYSGCF